MEDEVAWSGSRGAGVAIVGGHGELFFSLSLAPVMWGEEW